MSIVRSYFVRLGTNTTRAAQVIATNTPSLKQQVYDAIKHSIIHCEYTPGSQLNEDTFCQRFGASRTPVRDALGRLEQEGLVVIQPKRGVLISPVSLRAINELFEVRQRIEPYALLTYGSRLSEDLYATYLRYFSGPTDDKDFLHALDAKFHYALRSARLWLRTIAISAWSIASPQIRPSATASSAAPRSVWTIRSANTMRSFRHVFGEVGVGPRI